jgi:hypothetical protein
MADYNLIVQDCYHPLDTDGPIQLTPMSEGDLTVANALHYIATYQALGDTGQDPPETLDIKVNSTTLNVADCSHDHIAHVIVITGITYNLVVADGYHVNAVEACNASPVWHIIQSHIPEDFYLPTLSLEAWTDAIAQGEADLPFMRFEGYSGGWAEGLRLPDMRVTATGLVGALGALDARLSNLEFEGLGASRADSLKLPEIRLSAAATGGLVLILDKLLPCLVLDAEFLPLRTINLVLDLPPLSISASGVADGIATLDKSISTLILEAYSYGAAGGILDALLPTLKITDGQGLSGDVLTLTATLPVLVIRPMGTGVGAGGQSDPAVLQDESRFTDYVLRYAR